MVLNRTKAIIVIACKTPRRLRDIITSMKKNAKYIYQSVTELEMHGYLKVISRVGGIKVVKTIEGKEIEAEKFLKELASYGILEE